MAIQRTYHCDGPECEAHASTAGSHLPMGFLRVTGDGPALHFCTWDCVLRHAAQMEPTEFIPVGPTDGSAA